MLGVISLAQYTMAATRGWVVNSPIARLRLKAENDQLRQHVAFLTEERRIKVEERRNIHGRPTLLKLEPDGGTAAPRERVPRPVAGHAKNAVILAMTATYDRYALAAP